MYRNFTVKTVKCQSQKMDKGPFLEQDPNQDWKYGELRLVLSLHLNFGIFFSPYGSLYISWGID